MSPQKEFVKINQRQIDETKSLLTEFKSIFKFLNRKKSIRLIRKKISKKRRSRRINNDEAYNTALINFAKTNIVFGGQKLSNLNDANVI